MKLKNGLNKTMSEVLKTTLKGNKIIKKNGLYYPLQRNFWFFWGYMNIGDGEYPKVAVFRTKKECKNFLKDRYMGDR